MEDRFLDDSAVYEMLDDNSLEQRWGDGGIPNPIRVHDDDGPSATDAEARRFPAFDTIGAKEQTVPLKKRREELIELSSAMIRRTESADTDQHVPAVRDHQW